MGVSATETRDNPSVVDTIITGATIIDYTGIIKADIGIRDGKIVAIVEHEVTEVVGTLLWVLVQKPLPLKV